MSALLCVSIGVPGVVVSRCQRTPRAHRVVLVRRHPDRRDGSCGHRDQLGLDGRRNIGCQSQSISLIFERARKADTHYLRCMRWCVLGTQAGVHRDGKVRFGSVRNGPVLVLKASEPEPDLFFSFFFLFFSFSELKFIAYICSYRYRDSITG